jgi:hypothetical protein
MEPGCAVVTRIVAHDRWPRLGRSRDGDRLYQLTRPQVDEGFAGRADFG